MVLKKGRIGQIILNLVIQNNGETLTTTRHDKGTPNPSGFTELSCISISMKLTMDRKITAGIPGCNNWQVRRCGTWRHTTDYKT